MVGGCVTVPHGNLASASNPGWLVELHAEAAQFALSGRREVKVVYSLVNSSRQAKRLDFPTAQRFEVTMRDPEGSKLFQWSEDRSFGEVASSVVVNAGERLEYEAQLPTRDMVGGRSYTVEAVLPGYPETTASAELHPL